MNKIKLLVIVSTGLLLANIFLIATFIFQPKLGPGNNHFPEPKHIIIETLGLDEEQQRKYEALVQTHRSQVNSLNKKLNHSRRLLMLTLTQPESLPKLDSLKNDITDCLWKIENTRYDHFASIKKICRPDQLDEFEEIIKELPKLMGGGPGPGNRPLDSDRMGPPNESPDFKEPHH